MVVKTVEGSYAVAETIKNCEPDVVACYPITPSTHIAEDLEKFYADGKLKSFIAVEAEFSAISALVGASAAGARTFTATSSQGIALMHEVLFAASGMRLPIVMAVANRALSAPLNIWCDHQDTVSQRDNGWIQLYCETNQEMVDTLVQAYMVAEQAQLPAMVCMDGFYLTHSVEQISVPEKEIIKKYLPRYRPYMRLDPDRPFTFGAYAFPTDYQEFREDLQIDIHGAENIISESAERWGDVSGRRYGNGLWEDYMSEDAEFVLIAMGSVCGNIKIAVDEMRKEGKKVGLVRIKSFRPFPNKIYKSFRGKRAIGIFEKDISLGGVAPLYAEVLNALKKTEPQMRPLVSSFIGGLGGKDITVEHARNLFEKIMENHEVKEFV